MTPEQRQPQRRDLGPGADFDGLDVLAFLAELVLWTACGVAASRLAGGGWPGLVAAVVTVVVVIGAWTLVMAPRAPRRLPVTSRNLVVLALGGAATALLATQGAWAWTMATSAATGLMLVADRNRRTTRAGT